MIIEVNGQEIKCEAILNHNDQQIYIGHAYIRQDGDNAYYTAHGVDKNYIEDGDNINYTIKWECYENWKEIENEDEMCDWDEFTVEIS